jgi:primosomal protein N' (replication factor Y)
VPPPRFACFAIALPLYRVFEYAIDNKAPVIVGARYRLPFANGIKTGVLLNASEHSEFDPARIKPVLEQLDQHAILDEHMLALVRWMSDYYLALERRSPRQFEICQALRRQPDGLTAADLKQINPHWHAVMKALQAKQVVRWEWIERPLSSQPSAKLPVLSDEQHGVLLDIESGLDRFAVHLLDGITGSGKTEIYLRLIADRLAAAMQVIYLVPEIGLTDQLIERVRSRFGDCFALSHSGLTELQRYQAWDRFRRGEVSIMLGTRSSLFSQCDRLGLIIIDEEHDHSYRQEDGVRYHARDVAIKRAQMLDIPIVLGSATPSLESIANCARETYFRHRLDQRPTRYPPPPLQLIDVRNSRFDFGCSAAGRRCAGTVTRV